MQSSSSSYDVSQPGSKILVQISTTAPQTSICFHMPHLYQLLPVVLHSCLAWICREQSDMSTYLLTSYKWKFGLQSYIFHYHTSPYPPPSALSLPFAFQIHFTFGKYKDRMACSVKLGF